MELLRIIAMLFVMIVHASFMAFGVPTADDCRNDVVGSFGVFFFESMSVVCVNVFALISGWFGMKLRLGKLAGLFFQAVFFAAVILAVLVVIAPERYLNAQSLSTLLMLNANDYWFIKAYIGLCIFVPFLNTFVEKATEKELRTMLIIFYVFHTVYAWLSIEGARWLEGGYSAVSLAGLYVLARYVRLYGKVLTGQSARCYLSVYVVITLSQAVLAWLVTRLGLPIAGRLFTYTNPLVIVQSLSLLLFFSKLSFQSRWVNWVAGSSVAAYLLHANELLLRTYYAPTIGRFFDLYPRPSAFIATMAFIASVFIAAILIDKVRMGIMSVVVRKGK